MKAFVNKSPSGVARKSDMWEGEGASFILSVEPCRLIAPSKKDATGTCRMLGDLLQPARSDAVSALLVFLHLLEREAERIAQFSLAHCKHHAAHAHPAADVLVDWVR